jgi:autotransporter-associated beta strand protein
MPCLPTVDGRARDESCLRLHRFSRGKTRALVALLAAVLPLAAPAATFVWDGNGPFGGGNSRWSRGNNWAGNVAPPANRVSGLTNTDLTFAGALKTTPLMDRSYFIRSLTFNTNAGSFNLISANGQDLTVGGGGIVNYSANAQRIGSDLVLSNFQSWRAVAGNLNFGGTVNLGASALTIDGGFNTSFSNTLFGTGSLIKQGAGNLILAGTTANSFSGGVTLSGGTLTVAKSGALGSGPLTINSGTLNLGNYNLSTTTFALRGGNLVGSGALNATAYQFQSGTVNARLAGAGRLTKTTPGVVTVTASNSYTGGTLVSGGRLTVNNLAGSGTGSGNVTIANGGTLTGWGNISGIVTNGPGGTLSPGDIVGQLTIGSGVWEGGSINRFEIKDAAGTAGVGWDFLNVTGGLTVTATSGNKAFIDLVSLTLGDVAGDAANFDATQTYQWRLLQTGSGITFAPGENEQTVFELLTGGFSNPVNGGTFSFALANGGRDLSLTFTPALVPEPSVFAFLALSVCCFIYARRWRETWGQQPRAMRMPKPAAVLQRR